MPAKSHVLSDVKALAHNILKKRAIPKSTKGMARGVLKLIGDITKPNR